MSRQAMQRPRVLTTYSDRWRHRYLSQNYQAFDPVVRSAISTSGPFGWPTPYLNRTLSAKQRQVFDEAAEFGIRFGYTIPIRDEIGRISIITFATSEESSFLRNLRHNDLALHLLGAYFHIYARQLLGYGALNDAISLSPRETQCLQWAARGKTQWEIAHIIGIRPRTVTFHLENARSKLGASSTAEAVAKALTALLIASA